MSNHVHRPGSTLGALLLLVACDGVGTAGDEDRGGEATRRTNAHDSGPRDAAGEIRDPVEPGRWNPPADDGGPSQQAVGANIDDVCIRPIAVPIQHGERRREGCRGGVARLSLIEPLPSHLAVAENEACGSEAQTLALRVSDDGAVVSGHSILHGGAYAAHAQPFRWVGGITQSLGVPPGIRVQTISDWSSQAPHLMSQDGSVIAGSLAHDGQVSAFRWTQDEGMRLLPVTPDGWKFNMLADMNADGSVLVGTAAKRERRMARADPETPGTNPWEPPLDDSVITLSRAVRYDDVNGSMVFPLPDASGGSHVRDVSADGTVAVGAAFPECCESAANARAVRWAKESATPLEGMGLADCQARIVSDDGGTVLATCRDPSVGRAMAETLFRWRDGEDTVPLGAASLWASPSMSLDGSVVVFEERSLDSSQIVRWTEATGSARIGPLPGHARSQLSTGPLHRPLSEDGSVVIGTSMHGSITLAFRWSVARGLIALMPLSRHTGSRALGISADGSIVVGVSETLRPDGTVQDRVATLWDVDGNPRSLALELAARGVDVEGISLREARVQPNGRVILGQARDTLGRERAFVACLP